MKGKISVLTALFLFSSFCNMYAWASDPTTLVGAPGSNAGSEAGSGGSAPPSSAVAAPSPAGELGSCGPQVGQPQAQVEQPQVRPPLEGVVLRNSAPGVCIYDPRINDDGELLGFTIVSADCRQENDDYVDLSRAQGGVTYAPWDVLRAGRLVLIGYKELVNRQQTGRHVLLPQFPEPVSYDAVLNGSGQLTAYYVLRDNRPVGVAVDLSRGAPEITYEPEVIDDPDPDDPEVDRMPPVRRLISGYHEVARGRRTERFVYLPPSPYGLLPPRD